ncbi:helix-turn-helix domain-containing protein [Sphingomonas sp. SFZ2018-12]|uniref:XRE family transcriptional regulator n=1 Tax=Sphingomonas sp. SFZ2018-12 TaxID=2683197 RepID=UPI001F0FB7F9|nr:S24 family peptidase [Sphingomonas sp. SFZ2018-12]MCH4893397.1 helix-turn-helix domain-containing protein [Sphingomonas sp. SFZ2018-12]
MKDRASFGLSETVRALLNARVKEFGTQQSVADAAGISKATLQKILAGDSEPSFSRLVSLADVLDISLDEIAHGRPSRSIDGAAPEIVSIPMDDVFASAGPGALALEEGKTAEFIGFPKPWLSRVFGNHDQLRLIGIKGDSMEPTLSDGDLAMIDLGRREPSDGVYALVMDGMLLVKRLAPAGSGIVRVISDNKLTGVQRDIDVEAEADSFRVVGRVVWAGGKL